MSPWEPVPLIAHGIALKFYLPHLHDHIQASMRDRGQLYEADVLHDIYSRDLPEGIIVDVGANVGSHTVFFAKVLSRHVVSIEPCNTTFSILRQNVAINDISQQVTLVQKAVGANCGNGRLIAPPLDNLGLARIDPTMSGNVPIVTLDSLLPHQKIALMKIDVEGMELPVLQGATALLQAHRPILYIEAQTASDYAEIRRFLRPFGYEMARRFNATPTYAFMPCASFADLCAVFLERTESLTRLDDILAGQHELLVHLQRLSAQTRQENARSSEENNTVHRILERQQEQIEQSMSDLKDQITRVGCDVSEYVDKCVFSMGNEIRGLVKKEFQDNHLHQRAASGGNRSPLNDLTSIPLKLGTVTVRVPAVVPKAVVERSTDAGKSNVRLFGEPKSTKALSSVAVGPSTRYPRSAPTEAILTETSNPGRVSVIMTTYNSSLFVEAAIHSVLDQTYDNLELIIVDDASTDDTFAILQKAASDDPRVHPVKAFQNRGTYWCKNLGIIFATGEFITFQDSDDVSDRTRIERQVEELSNSDAVLCLCDYVRVDEAGNIVSNRGEMRRRAIMAPLFRKVAVVSHIGYYDSVRTSADDEYVRRIHSAFGDSLVVHLQLPLYRANVRQGSLTTAAQTKCELGKSDDDGGLAYLSAPRREYVHRVSEWHEQAKAAGDYLMPFPLYRRRFPAPAVLLPEKGRKEDFVTASLASMPDREANLEEVIESILPQVDLVNVYLNGYSATPPFLEDPSIRVIHSQDYGDLRDNGKFFFLGSLMWGYHFTIDDDIVYPPDYVQRCILKIEQYNRQAIVGCHGVVLANPMVRFMQGREVLHFARKLSNDRFVNLLGTGTTAYHVSALDLSFDDFGSPGMADVWLAIAAKRQGIPMVAIHRSDNWLRPLSEADKSSLYVEAIRDDRRQTELAQEHRLWELGDTCIGSDLFQGFLSRFSDNELLSRGVDIRYLAAARQCAEQEPAPEESLSH